MNRILVFALMVSVAGVVLSCGDEDILCEECSCPPMVLRGPCNVTADCAEGLQCDVGKCLGFECDIGIGTCRASLGEACDYNDDCYDYPDANSCINGFCSVLSGVSGPCDDLVDCLEPLDGLECEVDTCKAPLGATCENNTDCVGYVGPYTGNTCISGECTVVSGAAGSCDDDFDCMVGICMGGCF